MKTASSRRVAASSWVRAFLQRKPSPRAVDAHLLFLGFFLLYVCTSDRMYRYDSVLYASMIGNPLSVYDPFYVFTWNHPLWLATARAFYVLIRFFSFAGRAYQSLQVLNAFVGALGIALIYLTLSRRAARGWTLAWSLLIGGSNCYWARSTGGEPYLLGTLCAFGFAVSVSAFSRKRTWPAVAMMGLSLVLAASYHVANIILWPLALIAVLASPRGNKGKFFGILATFFLAYLLPYAWTQGMFSRGGIVRWWHWGSGLSMARPTHLYPTGLFDLDILRSVGTSLTILQDSFIRLPNSLSWIFWLAATGGLVCILLAPRREQAPEAGAPDRGWWLGGVFLVYFTLFTFWAPGDAIYWASHVVFLGSALCIGLAPLASNRPAGALMVLVAVFVGIGNFSRVIWPNMQGAAVKPLIELCEFINAATPPSSSIVVSGKHNPNLKVYLPYFAGRNPVVVDLIGISTYEKGKDPIQVLQTRIDSYLRKGRPVYMMENVWTSKDSYGVWDVTPERIDALVQRYRLFEVLRVGPPLADALYLVWPSMPTAEQEGLLCRELIGSGKYPLRSGVCSGLIADEPPRPPSTTSTRSPFAFP